MEEKLFIIPHNHKITKADRNKLKKHKSLTVWFTGLSGSGKSTIADRVEQLLMERGVHTYILDGDNIRAGLNKGLSFSEEDRYENLRRIAEVAKLFVESGTLVLSAFISPLKKDRQNIKSIIGEDSFVEVYIATSLEECERRDVKGLYAKARSGEITNFTGISAPYEIPEAPDLTVQTEGRTVDEAAEDVLEYLLKNKMIKKL